MREFFSAVQGTTIVLYAGLNSSPHSKCAPLYSASLACCARIGIFENNQIVLQCRQLECFSWMASGSHMTTSRSSSTRPNNETSQCGYKKMRVFRCV